MLSEVPDWFWIVAMIIVSLTVMQAANGGKLW